MSKGKGMKGDKIILKTKELIEITKNKIYENSLEIGKLVYAKFVDGKFEMAKIIDCKLLPEHENKKKKDEFSYDYYVHYLLHNRRMDQYIPRSDIKYVFKSLTLG